MARSRVSGSGARTAALLVAVLAIVAALGATAAPSNQRAAIDTSCGATVCAAGCCLNGQCLEAYPLACRLVAAVNWMQGTVDALKINDNVAPADVGAACSIGSMCKSGCCQGGTCSAASACAGATGTTKSELITYGRPWSCVTDAYTVIPATAAPATKTVGPSPTGANSTIPPEYLSTDFPMGVRLIDQDHWCLMVPDNDSKHIGEMEQNAHVRCSPAMVALSGGKLPAMNKGVIVTTHFSTGKSEDGKDTWVQMGGGFNGAAVPLAAGDTGRLSAFSKR